MALFTQDPKETNDPSYLGFAQDLEKPKAYSKFGQVLEGAGSIIGVGAKAITGLMNDQIEKETYDRVDAARKGAGVDAATDAAAAGVSIGTTKGNPDNYLMGDEATGGKVRRPTGFDEFDRTISKLKDKYDAGELSETYYNGILNKHVREMVGRWGEAWRGEIDQTMQRVAGVNPANALRKSIVADLDRTEKAQAGQANKDEAFVRQNLEYISPGMLRVWQGNPGNKAVFNQIVTDVADKQRDKAEVAQGRAVLAFKKDRNEATDDDFRRVAEKEGNQFVRTKMSDMLSDPSVGGMSGIQKWIDSDKVPSPQEQEALRQQWAMGRTKMATELRQRYNAPVYDTFDRSKKEALIEQSLKQWDDLGKALTDKDTGVLHRTATYLEAQKDSDMRRVLEKNDWLRKAQVLAQIDKNGIVLDTMRMNKLGPFYQGIIAAGDQLSATNLATGEGGMTENLKIRTGAKDGEGTKVLSTPIAIKQDVNNAKNQLLAASKDNNPVLFGNTAKGMFGPKEAGFLKEFSEESQPQIMAVMAGTEVSKAMIANKDRNPEAWNLYTKWVTDNVFAMSRTQIADLSGAIRGADSNVVVFWDPEHARFDVRPKPRLENAAVFKFNDSRNPLTMADELNRNLSILKPINEANGMDHSRVVLDMLRGAGLDPNAPKDKPGFHIFAEAVKNAAVRAGGAIAEGVTDPNYNPYVHNQPGARGASDESRLPNATDHHVPVSKPDEGHIPILHTIRKAEAGDVSNAYRKVAGSHNEYALDKMTVDQVMQLQGQMQGTKSGTTAVGAYQFTQKTLEKLKSEFGLTGEEKFDAKLQDRLASSMLNARGYKDWQEGKITRKQLVDNISREWAGLPNTEGDSHYKGQGLNKNTVKLRQLLETMPQPVKKEDTGAT